MQFDMPSYCVRSHDGSESSQRQIVEQESSEARENGRAGGDRNAASAESTDVTVGVGAGVGGGPAWCPQGAARARRAANGHGRLAPRALGLGTLWALKVEGAF